MKINADNRTLPCVMPHTGGGLDHATSHEACIRFQNLNLDLGAGCAQGETIKTKNTPEVPCACTHAKRAHQGIRMLNSCSPSQSLVEYGNAKNPACMKRSLQNGEAGHFDTGEGEQMHETCCRCTRDSGCLLTTLDSSLDDPQ